MHARDLRSVASQCLEIDAESKQLLLADVPGEPVLDLVAARWMDLARVHRALDDARRQVCRGLGRAEAGVDRQQGMLLRRQELHVASDRALADPVLTLHEDRDRLAALDLPHAALDHPVELILTADE
jgi:hypothetical protein